MTLLSTEDSNDSQKRNACCTCYSPNPRLSVLFTHPTPVSPCLAQRGSDMRGSTVHCIQRENGWELKIKIQAVQLIFSSLRHCY